MKSKFLKIINLCKSADFLHIDIEKNIIKYTTLGYLLSDNIKKLWMEAEKDIKVYQQQLPYNFIDVNLNAVDDIPRLFYNHTDFKKNFVSIKTNLQKSFPFATIDQLLIKKNIIPKIFDSETKTILNQTDNPFTVIHRQRDPDKSIHLLTASYFIHPTNSNEIMSRIERLKKIWWMKFTSKPDRIVLSDRKISNQIETVSINAKFDFGELELEKIQSFKFENIIQNNSDCLLSCSDTGELVCPFVIRTETCLDTATMGLLFDAFNADSTDQKILNLHRKITPFQCAVLLDCRTPGIDILELDELARYLVLTIKATNISLVNLEKEYDFVYQHDTELTLEDEINKMDKIGVPYCIILDRVTLENAQLKLRNRDTGLFETLHLSDIPNYLDKMISN